jgi:hypothetical protein
MQITSLALYINGSVLDLIWLDDSVVGNTEGATTRTTLPSSTVTTPETTAVYRQQSLEAHRESSLNDIAISKFWKEMDNYRPSCKFCDVMADIEIPGHAQVY